jgi:hypothetical protein
MNFSRALQSSYAMEFPTDYDRQPCRDCLLILETTKR